MDLTLLHPHTAGSRLVLAEHPDSTPEQEPPGHDPDPDPGTADPGVPAEDPFVGDDDPAGHDPDPDPRDL